MEVTKEFDFSQIKKLITNSSLETSVYIGCDSQIKGRKTSFVTVIIVHYDSKHGAKIFYQTANEDRRMSLREKLWKEVTLAGECALEMVDAVGARPFSVHLDINPNPEHKSSVISKEAIWYIRGLGLTPVVKPKSFAASHVADYVVRR